MLTRGLATNRLFIIGILISIFLIFFGIFAPLISPYDPFKQNLNEALNTPSVEHPLGQDELGRDILSRIIYGSRISLIVGILTVVISLIIGIIVGSIAGYCGGIIDEILMRIIDIFLAFPGILLAIALVSFLGPGIKNVIIALSVMGWVGYARLVRGQILYIREMEYVLAIRALGGSGLRIILRHIIPNILSPIVVEATFGMGRAIISEASLSFLGLGVKPPNPSWGSMLNEGVQFLLVSSHLTTFPGIAIMTVVLGFNLLGDGLRDILNPKGGGL
jgi:peptide/nickel transport system permease protein